MRQSRYIIASLLVAVSSGFILTTSVDRAHAFPALELSAGLERGESLLSHEISPELLQVNGSHGYGPGAQSFVQDLANEAIGFLGNNNLSDAQKKSSFKRLLQKAFDMKTIGRFVLGRYWRVATPAQRSEYQTLFNNMVVEVYSNRFSDYTGQKFVAKSFAENGTKDTIVTSFIVPPSGPQIQVDWRIRYKNGTYKVVDVIVEGVSMSVTQRSDFSSVIQRGGGDVSALLEYLRKQ